MLQLHRSTFQKFLIWAFVLLLLNTYVNALERDKKINCKVFIFHPKCRGVAAKRALLIPNSQTTEERNYQNRNRDSPARDILLNNIPSRIEANGNRDSPARDILLNYFLSRIEANGNRDSVVRDILLDYIISRNEANDNDVNTDIVEDWSSYP